MTPPVRGPHGGATPRETTGAMVAPERRSLTIHIAHENSDGSWPDRYLCGAPVRILLPGPERRAGDATRSECDECNRLDAAWPQRAHRRQTQD